MLVKRSDQLQSCWDKADKLQVMFYFHEIKQNRKNTVHLELRNVKILLTWRGFYNLDPKFYGIKCFVLKSFQEPSRII